MEWKDALWHNFSTAAPQRRQEFVEHYKIVEESLRALAGRYMGLIGAFAPQGRTFHAVCKYFAIQRKWASVSKRRDCPIIQRARG
jgi:hypothetical protein